MSYHITILRPDGTREDSEQPKVPELEQLLQKAVGGYIETVPYLTKFEGHTRVTAYCNEEGHLHEMPLNEAATAAWLAALGPGPFSYPPRLHGPVILYWKEKPSAPTL